MRDQLERLCRYVARPAVAERRLSISPQDRVRYELKTRWKKSATHVEFQPVEFIATPAAPVPQPRAHLARFHGIFAPNANLHEQLTPAGRGRRPAADAAPAESRAPTDDRTRAERRRSMTWAQRHKRVFNIDVTTMHPLRRCGSWRASKSPPPSGTFRATSRSTTYWRPRTIDQDRAGAPAAPAVVGGSKHGSDQSVSLSTTGCGCGTEDDCAR